VHAACMTNPTAHAPFTLIHHLCGAEHLDSLHSVYAMMCLLCYWQILSTIMKA